ncbi:hypothetical protein B0T22DRAFT_127241 [Podospora appendiculata]|uniref:Uncharacterized protein n=1 Tax=Podospora appendiculata TaxID=314037 RepID=A0AAE1CBC3_9PEZI|nr:hypothetical protein B0T22DRAFT_127241 [Podospora appendiculata]
MPAKPSSKLKQIMTPLLAPVLQFPIQLACRATSVPPVLSVLSFHVHPQSSTRKARMSKALTSMLPYPRPCWRAMLLTGGREQYSSSRYVLKACQLPSHLLAHSHSLSVFVSLSYLCNCMVAMPCQQRRRSLHSFHDPAPSPKNTQQRCPQLEPTIMSRPSQTDPRPTRSLSAAGNSSSKDVTR